MSDTRETAEEWTMRWMQVQFEVSCFITALIPNYHDARDVVQQVAVVALSKYDTFDQERSFKDWVMGIARYEVLKYRERNAREKLVFCQAIIDQVAEAYRRSDQGIDRMHHALRLCLKTVKGRNREALSMWYTEQAGAGQIARKLGITENAIYVLLHRVRNALRACVERRLIGMEEAL